MGIKSLVNIIPRSEILNISPLDREQGKNIFFPLFFNIFIEVLANEINQEKEMKAHRWEGEKLPVFIFRQHDCLCRKA